jgi:hypothetical protein
MQPWLSCAPLRQICLFADCVEGVEVVEPQATTEPTGRRIQSRMGKELQREIAALENHPASVTPDLVESESGIKPRSPVEIARREIGGCGITHSGYSF